MGKSKTYNKEIQMIHIDLDEVIEDLKKHEGYRSRVYDDSLGIPTIGYGFAIKDLELDEEDCDRILNKKLSKLIRDVFSRFPFLKDQPNTVKSVVLNMCYQMGVTGVSKFKMFLKALGERDYGWASTKKHRTTPNGRTLYAQRGCNSNEIIIP